MQKCSLESVRVKYTIPFISYNAASKIRAIITTLPSFGDQSGFLGGLQFKADVILTIFYPSSYLEYYHHSC